MDASSSQAKSTPSDRWWFVALVAAVCTIVEVVLLWKWPTSIWTWALGAGLLVYAVITWYHLTTWYRRTASKLIGFGGAAGVAPSLLVHFQIFDQAVVDVLVKSSPIVTACCFLLAGWLAWLDYRKDVDSSRQENRKHNNDPVVQQASGSSQIAGSTFHGPTTIQTGVSEETVQKILERHASERSDWLDQLSAKDEQISELRNAVDRVQRQADTGDQQAKDALEAARSTGDAAGLLKVLENRAEVLIDRVESGATILKNNTEEFIAVSREIAVMAYSVGDIAKAESSTRAILRLLPNNLDAINRLGQIQFLRAEWTDAEQQVKRVLELAVRDADRAVAYGNLGLIYQTRGDLDRAEEMHKKSLAMSEQLGQKECMASEYGNLGLIYQTRGDLDRAEEMIKKSLAIEEQLGRKEAMASDYGNLGIIFQNRGDLDRAEEMHQKALAIDEQLGRKEGMAKAYGNLGVIYQTRRELDRAEELYEKSLEISKEIGQKECMANQYANLGLVYESRSDRAKAREYWIRSRDLYAEIGMPHMVQQLQDWIDGLSDDADGAE